MSVFSDAELTYLAKGKLGRLATIDGAGMPHVVPLGWRYNPGLDVIDIGGRGGRRVDRPHHPAASHRSDQLGDGARRGIRSRRQIRVFAPPLRPACLCGVPGRGMAESRCPMWCASRRYGASILRSSRQSR